MVNSNVIVCAIILSVSFHKIASVSGFSPRKTAADYANNTNYETSQRKPVTQETDDETSQEDSSDDNENDSDDSGETNEFDDDKNCTCSGSSCTCCINLNLSFIDLGGPGCVKFSYVPDNDTMAVNMSYGERLLESGTLKRGSPEPTCMDLFSDLAQMCAKFTDLSRVANGVKGCVSIEPLLLGVSQTSYDVGCFNMDVEGVQPQTTPTPSYQYVINNNGTKESPNKPDENEEEELAAAISQSAEEGIAWFNNFISSVFGDEGNNETSTEAVEVPRNKTSTVKITS